MNSSSLNAKLRDLAVLLRRGNTPAADSIIQEVTGYLETLIQCSEMPATKRAQQTSFAMDEVRTLLSAGDLRGAAAAAVDAAREWTAIDRT